MWIILSGHESRNRTNRMHYRKLMGSFPIRVTNTVSHCLGHVRIGVESKLGFEERDRFKQAQIKNGGPGGQDSIEARQGGGQGLGLPGLIIRLQKPCVNKGHLGKRQRLWLRFLSTVNIDTGGPSESKCDYSGKEHPLHRWEGLIPTPDPGSWLR